MVPQPNDAQTQIQAKNDETYDQLISLIENTQGRLAPIIVACDDEALRQRVIKRYESEAWKESIRPYRLVLGQEPSMRSGLESLKQQEPHLQRGGKAVFTVTGAELLLRVKLNPQDEQSELDKFFGYLQWTREGLREFRYPIVLWVTHRILLELSRRSADFWSWRKAVLRFEAESPFIQNAVAGSPSLRSFEDDPDTEPLPPLAELQAEIAELAAKNPDALGLATLYDRLGQVYAQRISQGIAKNLEQEREQSTVAFQQAIAHYQAQNDSAAEMWALIRLGSFFEAQSRYSAAIASFRKSLDIARSIKDGHGKANSLKGLGNAYKVLGQYQRAAELHQQSLKIEREIGDRNGEGGSLCNLGHAYSLLGQYQQSVDFYQEALDVQREVGNRDFESNSLTGLGNVYCSLGKYRQAIDFHQQALTIYREVGNHNGEASSLSNIGNAYSSSGQYQQAIDCYQQALAIEREIGDRNGEGGSLCNLGHAYSLLGQHQLAVNLYQQALDVQREVGNRYFESNSFVGLGNAYHSLGQYQRALNCFQKTLESKREIGDQDGEADSLHNIATTLAELGQSWEALQHYQQAKQIYQSLEMKHKVLQCDTAIYELQQNITEQ